MAGGGKWRGIVEEDPTSGRINGKAIFIGRRGRHNGGYADHVLRRFVAVTITV
jgi:hypothetical protein